MNIVLFIVFYSSILISSSLIPTFNSLNETLRDHQFSHFLSHTIKRKTQITVPDDWKPPVNREKSLANAKYDLIIGVITAQGQKYFQRRETIRSTWGQFVTNPEYASYLSGFKCKLFFYIGSLTDENTESIMKEQKKYSDIVVADHITDTYSLLTQKTKSYFEYVYANYLFQYVAKVDDDIFLHIPELIKLIQKSSKLSEQQLVPLEFNTDFVDIEIVDRHHSNFNADTLFLGASRVRTKPYPVKGHPWHDPVWKQCPHYPRWMAGSAYVMGKEVVAFVSQVSVTPIQLPGEDVSMAVWLQANYINFVGSKRFNAEDICVHNTITTHYTSPEKIRRYFNNVISNQPICS